MTNTFVYGLVAYGTTPLADYASCDGNFRTIAKKILNNVDTSEPNAISEHGKYVFQSITDNDRMTYLCLTDKKAYGSLRINFLNDLRTKWKQKYGNGGMKFTENSKINEFGPIIKTLFTTYNSERAQKLAKAKENILIAQDQTTKNLKLALQRGEQLEVMEMKAEKIKKSSHAFQREAKKAKVMMCWQRWKMGIILTLIVIFIIFILILIICGGFSFRRCSTSKD